MAERGKGTNAVAARFCLESSRTRLGETMIVGDQTVARGKAARARTGGMSPVFVHGRTPACRLPLGAVCMAGPLDMEVVSEECVL